MRNRLKRSSNARDVIVMRWPHGMQVAKTAHICLECVCVCLFANVVWTVDVVDKHFGSLTFKLHTHFPLNIYELMFMDRTRRILLIHNTHSYVYVQMHKIQSTYHFGCIIAGNKFFINVPPICYIRWVGISTAHKSNICTFWDATAGSCALSVDRNRHFRSIFHLNSQSTHIRLVQNSSYGTCSS